MKKISILLILSIFIISCSSDSENKEKKIVLNYKNGKRAIEGKLINGKRIGEWRQYYPDGKIFITSEISQEFEDFYNYLKEYNTKGQLVKEMIKRESDTQHSAIFDYKHFNDNGKLFIESEYKIELIYEEDREGYETINEITKHYYDNGNTKFIEYSVDYETTKQNWFDSLGTFMGEIRFDNKNITINNTK